MKMYPRYSIKEKVKPAQVEAKPASQLQETTTTQSGGVIAS
jgi:hypothetical protein